MANSDYISREAAMNLIDQYWQQEYYAHFLDVSVRLGSLYIEMEGLPAADVRPVKPGKWERMPDNDVFGDIHCKCSACGEDWWQGPGWFRNAHFCPNCGAEMEKQV